MARARNEQGFGLVELLIAMTVMSIALMAIVATFSSGSIAIARAAAQTTGSTIADAQMETYRAMPSRDIGIDTSATLDATYKNDSACQNTSTSKTCAANGVPATEIGPTGSTPNSCTTINTWYPNTLPCTPSRTVNATSTPPSPDGRAYRVDTYVIQVAAGTTGSVAYRSRKQVTVVVRDTATTRVLVRQSSIFDCSTGTVPNSSDC